MEVYHGANVILYALFCNNCHIKYIFRWLNWFILSYNNMWKDHTLLSQNPCKLEMWFFVTMCITSIPARWSKNQSSIYFRYQDTCSFIIALVIYKERELHLARRMKHALVGVSQHLTLLKLYTAEDSCVCYHTVKKLCE